MHQLQIAAREIQILFTLVLHIVLSSFCIESVYPTGSLTFFFIGIELN